MLPNKKYVIYVPSPNNCFFFKRFLHFLLKISHKKNSIWRNFVSIAVPRFWLIVLSNSNIFFFKTISASSAEVSLEICLLSLVYKNSRREARPSPCGMLGQRPTTSTVQTTSIVQRVAPFGNFPIFFILFKK